ncbi:MAG: hypothetical protein F9K35_07715 [Burkholderiaceae bacterium]|nr:MAG: hypothetical protein F9K35_07715 [Burkholderiaceae bacterium]
MKNQPTTLWRCTAVAGAAMALAACGGGGGGDEPSTPPASGPSTQELVQKYVQANEVLLAQRMPDGGAERYSLLDACYLGNGSTKATLVSNWNATQAQNTAYQVGRKLANVQVLAERKTTNADGSARHEVDIGYDEQYTDGTAILGQVETLVAGSTSGACATPQAGEALRALGNRRVVNVGLVSRNRLQVFRKLADGQPAATEYQLRREVLFSLTDPSKTATYAVISWASGRAGAAPHSLKLLSPRIARDAAEMQGVSGNANWTDGDRFRNCRSNADNSEANAATADCTKLGFGTDAWGSSVTRFDVEGFAAGDTRFANWGLDKAGAEVTFAIHADDGWKSVNGQQGKTPIATYTLKIKNAAYPFAQFSPQAYPQFLTITPSEADIVAAFKAGGGTAQAELQAVKPPAGGLPMVRSSVYSYRQGPKAASAAGPVLLRTAIMSGTVAADGKTATIPFGGKPDGASATNYAEFGLTFTDRNGRDMQYVLQYQ